MAIALGQLFGLSVVVTCGTDEKCGRSLELGAAAAFNYRTQDFVEEVQKLTGGEGVAVVLDIIGGDYVPRNLNALSEDGRHVSIAWQRGARPMTTAPGCAKPPPPMPRSGGSAKRSKRPEGRDQHDHAGYAEFKTMVADEIRQTVWPYVEGGKLRPVVDSVFPLTRAAEAHARMEAGEHVGKIVLEVGE